MTGKRTLFHIPNNGHRCQNVMQSIVKFLGTQLGHGKIHDNRKTSFDSYPPTTWSHSVLPEEDFTHVLLGRFRAIEKN